MFFFLKKKYRIIYYTIIAIVISLFSIYFTTNIIFKRNQVMTLGSYSKIYNRISSIHGFVSLSPNTPKGPITVNRELDDGTKVNIYSLLSENKFVNKKIAKKNQRIAIVMFAENVQPNSFAEHAISEFYQYSNIHGYKFFYNHDRYDRDNELFYMKIHVLTEAITEGLKEKKFDWIFWVDCDTVLANPSIKLETFLPDNDKVHFIAADRNGINAGVFFLRVHPWSLNFILRAGSHAYFNKKDMYEYGEETSFKKLYLEAKNRKDEDGLINEIEHFVLVPPNWFNTLPEDRKRGDFILHPCLRKKESKIDIYELRKEIKSDKGYISSASESKLRKEVKGYYSIILSQWKYS